MSTLKPQAISGVSPGIESHVMHVWPSIAANALGRFLGLVYDAIPLRLLGNKFPRLSNLLFTLPTIPIAIALYFWTKILGRRYLLTNRSVQTWTTLGSRMLSEVALPSIDDIAIDERPGQSFYKAADMVLLAENGSILMRLEGVTRPEVFRRIILETRDARTQTEASLATIKARQNA